LLEIETPESASMLLRVAISIDAELETPCEAGTVEVTVMRIALPEGGSHPVSFVNAAMQPNMYRAKNGVFSASKKFLTSFSSMPLCASGEELQADRILVKETFTRPPKPSLKNSQRSSVDVIKVAVAVVQTEVAT
jgi:hypothetical protein